MPRKTCYMKNKRTIIPWSVKRLDLTLHTHMRLLDVDCDNEHDFQRTVGFNHPRATRIEFVSHRANVFGGNKMIQRYRHVLPKAETDFNLVDSPAQLERAGGGW